MIDENNLASEKPETPAVEAKIAGSVGRAVDALNKSLNSVQKALNDAVSETTQQLEQNLRILDVQKSTMDANSQEIKNLTLETDHKRKQAEADIQVWKTTSNLAAAKTIAENQGYILLSKTDQQNQNAETGQLKAKVQKLENETANAVNKAVEDTRRTVELENRAATAEKTAELDMLKKQVASLQETVADLRTQITEERDARVQIETGRAGATINVGEKSGR